MRKIIYLLVVLTTMLFVSCENNLQEELIQEELPNEPTTRQARANFIVTDEYKYDIKVYVDTDLPVSWVSAISSSLDAWNSFGGLYFRRVTSAPYDIRISQSAGVMPGQWSKPTNPSSNGKPGSNIIINRYAESVLSSTQKITCILASIGFNVGFRATDWASREGTLTNPGIGISGTPNSGSNPDLGSIFNIDAVESGRGFSNYDKIAINTLYPPALTSITGSAIADTGTDSYTYSAVGGASADHIQWEIPAGVQYANYGKTVRLNFFSAGIYEIKCRAIYGTFTTDWEVKSIEVFNIRETDRWHIFNLRMDGPNHISYDLVYKPYAKDLCVFELYVLFLYIGTYDLSIYSKYIWEDWYYTEEREYVIPTVALQHGSYEQVYGITCAAGGLGIRRVIKQPIYPGFNLSNIEVVNIYGRTNDTRYCESYWL